MGTGVKLLRRCAARSRGHAAGGEAARRLFGREARSLAAILKCKPPVGVLEELAVAIGPDRRCIELISFRSPEHEPSMCARSSHFANRAEREREAASGEHGRALSSVPHSCGTRLRL